MRGRLFTAILLAGALSLAIVSCGGGGGGGSPLAGTWFGTWMDDWGDVYTVQFTITSDGDITDWLQDGEPLYEGGSEDLLTGTVTHDEDQVYSIELSDGSVGGLVVDPGNGHLAYLDDLFYFGILQKGAESLPGDFALTDFVGTWSGYSVLVDDNVDIVEEGETVLHIDNEMDVIGTTLDGAFAGTVVNWEAGATYGVAYGWTTAEDVFFEIFLSVDKQFAASYACPEEWVDFTDCEFGAWAREVENGI